MKGEKEIITNHTYSMITTMEMYFIEGNKKEMGEWGKLPKAHAFDPGRMQPWMICFSFFLPQLFDFCGRNIVAPRKAGKVLESGAQL